MPNILYLSYDGLTDPLGQSQILPYLTGLSKKGFNIHIISFEKEERFLKYRTTIEQLTSNANIQWTPLTYHKRPPVLSTLLDIRNLRKVVYELVHQNKIDIIHCRSYITSLVGLSVKKKLKIPFVFDMRGFWADERVEGGLWNLGNPVFKRIYTYFKRKEQEFLQHADAIISLTENAKSEIDKNFLPGSSNKITVISCCVDLEHFSQQDLKHSGLRDKLGIKKDEFVLLYLGSIGTWYMIEEMLDFYEALKKVKPGIRFLLLTNDQDLLISKLKTRDLNYTIFKESEPINLPTERILISQTTRDKVPEFIQMSDASIFFILPSFSKKASSATKMGEVLAMNKPVITNSGYGDVDMLLSDSNYGVLVKSMDTEGYSRAIKDLEHLISLQKNNIRELAETYYSLEEGVNKYQQVYEKITKP